MPKKPTNVSTNTYAKYPNRAELEKMWPMAEIDSIPEAEWLTEPEVLGIGRDLVKAPTKPKGQRYEPSAGYIRHKKAPYAFNYCGHLREAFWEYRFATKIDIEHAIRHHVRGGGENDRWQETSGGENSR